ncbi:GDSL esterase/lipase At1g29670-like [Primulina tabacum]|uniref:GDSL esterase/lipase At1g29670-like n=1 Tax=Primulina tabacum TaxID=48773 RepID=UPI003F5916CF
MAAIIANPKWVVIFVISFFMKSQVFTHGQQQVPCLFLFGASLTDNGNNNMLSTLLKSNYPPYGIDFPTGPTGRFSNGENIPDFIAKLPGIGDPIPPFATATGAGIVKGVNYASAGAGILDDTGIGLGDQISMNEQLSNHQVTILRLAPLLGPSQVQNYLNKCVYTVEIGSNDYINNYIQPKNYTSSASFTPDQFAAFLIQQFSTQLEALYTSGARKVAIYGLAQLGCIPQVLMMIPANSSGCVDYVNNYVQLFNNRLKPLVDDLNSNLPDAIFTYINITSITSINPSSIGITIFNVACCVVSSVGVCVPNQAPCIDRDLRVFFDNYHTTEIVNRLIASRSYNSLLPTDAYPFDIKHLAQQ